MATIDLEMTQFTTIKTKTFYEFVNAKNVYDYDTILHKQ